MKQVNRLIQKVKDYVQAKAERLIMAWVTPLDNGMYESECHLWAGTTGSGRVIVTSHNSLDEAMEHIERIAAEYPNKYEEVNIYYDDVEE